MSWYVCLLPARRYTTCDQDYEGVDKVEFKENLNCISVQLPPAHFLIWQEECENFYKLKGKPVNDGHGIHFKLGYTSPGEKTVCGSISLTFYATTGTLHIQGNSHLLWLAEHMPLLNDLVWTCFSRNAAKWIKLAEEHKIGINQKKVKTCAK